MVLDDLYKKARKKVEDYFAPAPEVRTRDFIREIPNAVSTTFNAARKGEIGQTISRGLEQFDYFKPTEQVRARDFVREIPTGVDKSLQGLAQSIARFGISLAELPGTFRTGQATGQFYNTPLGRLNSFQSEAQNRVQRGDPMWKAIGNPALDTILAGADVSALASPILNSAKNFNHFGKVGEEIRALAGDLTVPLGRTMKMTIPARMENVSPNIFDSQPGMGTFRMINGKMTKVDGFQMARKTEPTMIPEMQVDVPFEFKSKTMNMRPGLTIKETGDEGFDAAKILNGEGSVKRRSFIQTVKDSKNTSPELKQVIEGVYVPKSGKELKSVAKKFIMEDMAGAEQRALNPSSDVDVQIGNELIAHYMANGDITKAKAITEGMANSGTEFGRAVQAFANYDKTTPEGALKFAQQTVDKFNRLNPNKKLDINNDQIKSLFERATNIQAMPEGRERNLAAGQLMEEIHNLIPSSIGDKVITVWKAGLLTSLRTHERNLIGNTMHTTAEVGKDLLASPLDRMMALRTGQRTKTFTVKGMGSGAKEGLQNSADVLRYGFDPEEAISKYDVRHVTWGNNPIEQGLKKYTDAVFRSLGAADKPFYHSAFARSLYDQAGAAAINAGRKGDKAFIDDLVKNATEEMKMIATRDASTATFKNETIMGKAIQAVKREFGTPHIVNGVRISGEIPGFLTEMIAPFTGVPSAVASQMAAYSPIGLVKGAYKTGKVMIKNLPELQRQASEELSRGIVGSGIMGLGAALTAKGLMTGNPKDAAEARQWELEGKQANSILIGGRWRSINSVGPEALIALAGSKLQSSDSGQKAAANIGKDFMSQTFLQGVQQPLNAINDPERYGQTYVKGQVGSIVPNAIKDVSSAFDKNQRETNSVGEGLKYGIPGLRNTLLPKRDALGNELPNEKAGIASFVDLFNSKTPIDNPTVNELKRLNEANFNSVPSKIDKKQTILGEKIEFNPQELDKLEEQTGNALRPALDKLVASPAYQNLSDEKKKAMIQNVVADIRDTAKKGYKTGQPIGTKDVSNIDNKYFVPTAEGKVYVPKLDKEFKSQEEADFAVKKQDFIDSDKNIQIIGNKVLRKGEDGQVYTQSKTKYDTQVIGQKLERAKKNDSINDWKKYANEKYAKLQEQLNDPNTDELEKQTIQNDIDDLIAQYNKYSDYGGFTKPKKGKAPAKLKINLGKISNISTKLETPKLTSPKVNLSSTAPVKTAMIKAPKVKIPKLRIKQSVSTIHGAKRLA